MIKQDYYQNARANETVFRNILRDLKLNRSKRPMGSYIPEDLETEAPLQLILQQYSEGQMIGKFTILNFFISDANTAQLSFQNVAPLTGGGAELEYRVKEDYSVELKEGLKAWNCKEGNSTIFTGQNHQ